MVEVVTKNFELAIVAAGRTIREVGPADRDQQRASLIIWLEQRLTTMSMQTMSRKMGGALVPEDRRRDMEEVSQTIPWTHTTLSLRIALQQM